MINCVSSGKIECFLSPLMLSDLFICSYSIQRHMRYTKYYKNLFLGLLDMAIVNAFIVHRMYAESIQETPLSHVDFLVQLHEELLAVTDEDMEDDASQDALVVAPLPPVSPSIPTAFQLVNTQHTMAMSSDQTNGGHFKFRACKVCSILRGSRSECDGERAPAFTTRCYCKECSNERGRVFLCNKVRRIDEGNHISCFNIWHSVWKNGTILPSKTIRMRKTAEDARAVATPQDSIGTLFSPSSVFSSESVDYI